MYRGEKSLDKTESERYKHSDDAREFSWRFFLDIKSNKKILNILDNEYDTASFFISENVKSVVTLYHDLEKLNILNNKKKLLDYKNINFVNSIWNNLPFKKNSFDIVILGTLQGMPHTSNAKKCLLKESFSILKNGGQILYIIKNPFYLSRVIRRNKDRQNYKNKLLFYQKFINLNKDLLVKCGFGKTKVIQFNRGVLGETYCVYGNNFHAIDYYYKNFTGMKNLANIKRLVYSITARTKIYRYLADSYIFIADK